MTRTFGIYAVGGMRDSQQCTEGIVKLFERALENGCATVKMNVDNYEDDFCKHAADYHLQIAMRDNIKWKHQTYTNGKLVSYEDRYDYKYACVKSTQTHPPCPALKMGDIEIEASSVWEYDGTSGTPIIKRVANTFQNSLNALRSRGYDRHLKLEELLKICEESKTEAELGLVREIQCKSYFGDGEWINLGIRYTPKSDAVKSIDGKNATLFGLDEILCKGMLEFFINPAYNSDTGQLEAFSQKYDFEMIYPRDISKGILQIPLKAFPDDAVKFLTGKFPKDLPESVLNATDIFINTKNCHGGPAFVLFEDGKMGVYETEAKHKESFRQSRASDHGVREVRKNGK